VRARDDDLEDDGVIGDVPGLLLDVMSGKAPSSSS
jgi:hypothetical protein